MMTAVQRLFTVPERCVCDISEIERVGSHGHSVLQQHNIYYRDS